MSMGRAQAWMAASSAIYATFSKSAKPWLSEKKLLPYKQNQSYQFDAFVTSAQAFRKKVTGTLAGKTRVLTLDKSLTASVLSRCLDALDPASLDRQNKTKFVGWCTVSGELTDSEIYDNMLFEKPKDGDLELKMVYGIYDGNRISISGELFYKLFEQEVKESMSEGKRRTQIKIDIYPGTTVKFKISKDAYTVDDVLSSVLHLSESEHEYSNRTKRQFVSFASIYKDMREMLEPFTQGLIDYETAKMAIDNARARLYEKRPGYNNESQSTGRERKGSIYDILAAIAKKKAQQNK